MEVNWDEIRDRLYKAIAHGDDEHRAWLYAKLEAFFTELKDDQV